MFSDPYDDPAFRKKMADIERDGLRSYYSPQEFGDGIISRIIHEIIGFVLALLIRLILVVIWELPKYLLRALFKK